jgi:heterotetrameric sarcosine oxidase delta subunit
MFLIRCPFCGEREQSEFTYGGEAHIVRPQDPAALSDEDWANYLFMRANRNGIFAERWHHTAGCRRWFNALRDTSTDEFLVVYRIGETPPQMQGPPVPAGQARSTLGAGGEMEQRSNTDGNT